MASKGFATSLSLSPPLSLPPSLSPPLSLPYSFYPLPLSLSHAHTISWVGEGPLVRAYRERERGRERERLTDRERERAEREM